jgi:hypothetical protein
MQTPLTLAGRLRSMEATSRLLIACTQVGASDAAGRELRSIILSGPADWAAARRLARAHGISSMVFCSVARTAADLVPKPVLERFKSDSHAAATRSLLLGSELTRVVEELGRSGIRVIPFKGPVLSASLYEGSCFREFTDLDILIDPRDRAAAARCITALGYSAMAPIAQSKERPDVCHLTFANSTNGVILEVQCNIGLRWELRPDGSQPPLEFSQLWMRRGEVTLLGRPLPVIDAERLLLMLAVHGARHRWSRLLWISDISRLLLKRSDLNWPLLIRMASAYGCLRPVHLALRLVSELMGASLPRDIEDAVRSNGAVSAASAYVQDRLFTDPRSDSPPRADDGRPTEWMRDFAEHAYWVSLHDSWRQRLRMRARFVCARLKPNGADRAFGAMLAVFRPALYLIRPARLLYVYRMKAFTSIFRLWWVRAQ